MITNVEGEVIDCGGSIHGPKDNPFLSTVARMLKLAWQYFRLVLVYYFGHNFGGRSFHPAQR